MNILRATSSLAKMTTPKKLVWNAVLNYVLRSMLSGVPKDEIAKTCTDFFGKESIKEAKILIYSIVHPNVRPSIKHIESENVLDIMKILKECDLKSVELPTFVIAEPQEVPSCGSQISAFVTRNINEMNTKLDSLIARNKDSTTHSLPTQAPTSSTYAVILKKPANPPPSAAGRKAFIDKLCNNDSSITDHVGELKQTQTEWRINLKDKQAAEKLSVAILNGDNATLDPKMKTPTFSGIARLVPTEIDADALLAVVPNCVKAEQIRATRSFKLQFSLKSDLQHAMRNPPLIGYERIHIDEFINVPRRCFNCQNYGHLASKCENSKRCARCGEEGHASKKEHPCENPIRCALCKSDKHPCYSIRCPEVLKAMKKPQ